VVMNGVKSAFIPYEIKRDFVVRTKAKVKKLIAEYATRKCVEPEAATGQSSCKSVVDECRGRAGVVEVHRIVRVVSSVIVGVVSPETYSSVSPMALKPWFLNDT